jgi:DNA-binding NarL/FixJ family response regulator
VVLLDVEMPLMGVKQAIEIMLQNSPPPRVVIVTMYDYPRLVRELTGLGAVVCLVVECAIRSRSIFLRIALENKSRLGRRHTLLLSGLSTYFGPF